MEPNIEEYNNHLLTNVKCLQSYQKELLICAIENHNFGEARHILGMIEGYHEAIKEITDQYTSYNPEEYNINSCDVCCATCKRPREGTCRNIHRHDIKKEDLSTTWCPEYIKMIPMNEHIEAIEHLMGVIDKSGYSSKGNLLILSPDWMELKEHLVELKREAIPNDD